MFGKGLVPVRRKMHSIIEHFDLPPGGIGKTNLQFLRHSLIQRAKPAGL